jgi:quinol monooxygenase YgiN
LRHPALPVVYPITAAAGTPLGAPVRDGFPGETGTSVTIGRYRYARIPHPARNTVMAKAALYVPLQAKPGKENEVAEFLRSALPLVLQERETVSWYAIQEGPSTFAIFDTFDSESGRDAHLNGKVAEALMAKAGELLVRPPTIYKLDVLADKLPN